MKLVFTEKSAKDIEGLQTKTGRRIVQKMQWFASQNEPLSFAKKLTNSALGSHRFRIGDYRVLVDVEHDTIEILLVLAVRHRKDAYRL